MLYVPIEFMAVRVRPERKALEIKLQLMLPLKLTERAVMCCHLKLPRQWPNLRIFPIALKVNASITNKNATQCSGDLIDVLIVPGDQTYEKNCMVT